MEKTSIKQLIESTALVTKTTQKQTEETVRAFIEELKLVLCKGNAVTILGFGTFKPVHRAERTGHNPSTGEKVLIPASKCGELANFRIGALLKHGKAGYSDMYDCAKDYVRKHIAYIESHGIYSDAVEESLGDIAIYAVIMMYMKACYEQERKMKLAQIKGEAK